MNDAQLVQDVIVMLNEGMVDECACIDCATYKTGLAEGIIRKVREHDSQSSRIEVALPAQYGTSPTGTTTTRPMRSNL